jgi:hypothetical protein
MTYELSQKDELISILVEQYKSAYGFKPRGDAYTRLTEMSYAELQQEAEYMNVVVEQSIKDDEDRENRAVVKFLSRIAENLGLGAADEATAYRWLLQSEDMADEPDQEHIEYNFGLPYGYLKGRYA